MQPTIQQMTDVQLISYIDLLEPFVDTNRPHTCQVVEEACVEALNRGLLTNFETEPFMFASEPFESIDVIVLNWQGLQS